MASGEDLAYLWRLMGRRLLVLALGCLLAGPGRAQTLLPETAPRYLVARQVFDQLTYVFANSRPQPQLEILARRPGKPATIARYLPGNRPLIRLDEEAYEVCIQMGPDSLNALALLLGHELAHHYQQHDWHDTFGMGTAGKALPAAERQRFESEADFYGCFYGELAGFATGRVFPRLLDLLYQRFGLAEKLAGYPDLAVRKAVYQKKQAEALALAVAFRAGQFLYLVQEFGPAAQCFEYLGYRFPSREILNNLAAARLQQALLLYGTLEPAGFAYPVELDARSRLAAAHRAAPDPAARRQLARLLSEARQHAARAREMDPGYLPASINLACIYSLQGNQAAAIGLINEWPPARLTGNAATIRGIAYFMDGQTDKARQDFETAHQLKGYQAAYNLELSRQLTPSFTGNLAAWIRSWWETAPPAPKRWGRTPPEKIGAAAMAPLPVTAEQVQVADKPYLAIRWRQAPDHLQADIQLAARHFLLRYTGDRYSLPSARKIRRGSTAADLVQQYGEPGYTFPGPAGDYWVYPRQQLAFTLDRQGRVRHWLIYASAL